MIQLKPTEIVEIIKLDDGLQTNSLKVSLNCIFILATHSSALTITITM